MEVSTVFIAIIMGAKKFSRRQLCCIHIYLFIATNRDLFQSKLLSYSILEESYHLQLRWNDSNSPVQLQLHFDLDEVDVQIR